MKVDFEKQICSHLQRITNTLLRNAGFIDNIGLLNGKMGFAVFLFHCARFLKDDQYEEKAMKIMEEIQSKINIHTPCCYSSGLCGIGAGIEYLIQNGFVEGDADVILSEIEPLLFYEIHFRPQVDLSFNNGLTGTGYYYLHRLMNPSSNENKLSTLTHRCNLIAILDIISAYFGIEGYTYPAEREYKCAPKITFSDLKDIEFFLLRLDSFNLCNTQVAKIQDSISSKLEIMPPSNLTIQQQIREIALNKKHDQLNDLISIFALDQNGSDLINGLSLLSYYDSSLPDWWTLY